MVKISAGKTQTLGEKYTGLENDNWQQTHYHYILHQTVRGPPW